MKVIKAMLVLLNILLVAGFAHAGIIYVDDDNTIGPWDGTPEHPYQYIQDAIDVAWHSDTVLVKDGEYSVSKGPRNVNLDFHGEAISVRSENGLENCTIDCEHCGWHPRILFPQRRRPGLHRGRIQNPKWQDEGYGALV